HRIRVRRRHAKAGPTQPPTASRSREEAPVRWGLLYGFCIVALASHLVLDWSNNYGVRPFFPFNPRWYAGSFVFIVEPVMLLLLVAALVAPALFGLIAGEVGARRPRFRGRGWAIAALLAIAGLWELRFVEHGRAMQLAESGAYGLPADGPAEVERVAANPSPINPFAWHTVAETPGFYQLARVDTLRGTFETDASADRIFKPPTTLATLLAKRSWLGQAYLDWSSWPVVTDAGPAPLPASGGAVDPAPRTATQVTFRDLRFLYDVPGTDWKRSPPLGGEVFVDLAQPEPDRIAAMQLGGRQQR
ncbi:MAG: metal-dependent hydrolase, partial [Acidobacteriota bacterium]|nr:metal-dependent hydrolase [Acidobacteriota bacterium]